MTDLRDNVESLDARRSVTGGGNGGNGRDFGDRVSRLEARLNCLATKSDLESIKTWALKGAIAGIVITAGLMIGVLKLFG